uniref:Activating transcription factor 7-interacting protein Fn3 domain-containing protein n=1 Tax=Strigamia maritima TaxID=126957 RepID=T1IWP1_STRMM
MAEVVQCGIHHIERINTEHIANKAAAARPKAADGLVDFLQLVINPTAKLLPIADRPSTLATTSNIVRPWPTATISKPVDATRQSKISTGFLNENFISEYAPVAMPIVAPLLVRNPLFTEMLFTARPPQPSLSITGSRQLAIVLHWNLNLDNNHPDMLHYVIYACRGLTAPPPPRPHDWERLASVMATNLPMELKISNLINGETYYFAVAGVDVHMREGPLSRSASVRLIYNGVTTIMIAEFF